MDAPRLEAAAVHAADLEPSDALAEAFSSGRLAAVRLQADVRSNGRGGHRIDGPVVEQGFLPAPRGPNPKPPRWIGPADPKRGALLPPETPLFRNQAAHRFLERIMHTAIPRNLPSECISPKRVCLTLTPHGAWGTVPTRSVQLVISLRAAYARADGEAGLPAWSRIPVGAFGRFLFPWDGHAPSGHAVLAGMQRLAAAWPAWENGPEGKGAFADVGGMPLAPPNRDDVHLAIQTAFSYENRIAP